MKGNANLSYLKVILKQNITDLQLKCMLQNRNYVSYLHLISLSVKQNTYLYEKASTSNSQKLK